MRNIVRSSTLDYAVEADGLVKRFGDVQAVDGLSLRVPTGAVFGLLGANGAGKSTAIRLFATLLRPDSGSALVLGHDTVRDAAAVRSRIALTGQFASVDEDLTGRENLIMLARLCGHTRPGARVRADELLASFELTDAARRSVRTYSGGMRRRLDLAASLTVAPDLLFLDEPTTGLDPRSRNQVWECVRELAWEGTTVLLTTQYLEEADRLANRLAVLHHGKVVAEGTSSDLKESLGQKTMRVKLADVDELPDSVRILSVALDQAVGHERESATLTAQLTAGNRGTEAAEQVARALQRLSEEGIAVLEIGVAQPSLDDVFLSLTTTTPVTGETAV